MDLSPKEIGERIKSLRKDRGWTLQELSRRCGVSISAVSKIENAQVTVSFDTLVKIARGFDLSFDALLVAATDARRTGRFTITRQDTGLFFSTDMYEYHVHSAELRQKQIIPLHMVIKSRELEDITRWSSHEGEEFVYVLAGTIELHTELYAPALLKKGDSAYFDSSMAHAFLNRGRNDAEILSICLSQSLDFPADTQAAGQRPEGRDIRRDGTSPRKLALKPA